MKLKIDGKEFSIGISQTAKGPVVIVNNRKIRTVNNKNTYSVGSKKYNIKVVKKTDTTYQIGIGQDSYHVEIEESNRLFKNKVKAPMQGIITSIDVKPGQYAKKGQTLFRMMAMKMENEIKAESDCTVRAVMAKSRQKVMKGETIIELEDADGTQ